MDDHDSTSSISLGYQPQSYGDDDDSIIANSGFIGSVAATSTSTSTSSQVEIELDHTNQTVTGGSPGALADSLGLTYPIRMKPDEESTACDRCTVAFTMFNRRHHCRACGNIFCANCSKDIRLLPPKFKYNVPQRVCIQCVESNQFWPFHSKVVTTDKAEVEYVSVGEGSKVILVFHGAIGGFDQALLYAHPLWNDGMESYFTVIAFSRPGYLLTPLESGASFEDQADLAASLLDTLSVTGKVGVIGSNTGGPAAIQFAVRHPDRTAALTLLSAITKAYWLGQGQGKPLVEAGVDLPSKLFLGPLQGLAAWGTRSLPDTALQNYLEQTSKWDEGEAAIHAYNINRNPIKKWMFQALVLSMQPYSDRKVGYENDLSQLRELQDLPLNRVSVPTLIMHGLDDADVLKEHAEHAKEALPTFSTLTIYKGAGANVYLGTEADQVRDNLVRFMSENVIA